MILVSSCLLGFDTKYDGGNNANDLLMKYSHLGKYIPVCPEQMGGLSTPRKPAEITRGSGVDVIEGSSQVLNILGNDVTAQFAKGASIVLGMAEVFPVTAVILKERSPSCGSREIYDGKFRGKVIPGEGVTTALLRKHNIPVYSEEELTPALLERLLGQQ